MFKAELKARFIRIFGIKRVSFNAINPEAPEQNCLFIEIASCRTRIQPKVQSAIVKGQIVVFAQSDDLPFGFFEKRIQRASPADIKPFFFEPELDVPDSPSRIVNLSERRVPFTFLYDSQYDPTKGTIEGFDVESIEFLEV